MKIKVWVILRQGQMHRDQEWYVNQVLDGLRLDGATVRSQLATGSKGSMTVVDALDDETAVLSLMSYADKRGVGIDLDRDDVGRLSFTDRDGCRAWLVYARSGSAEDAPTQGRTKRVRPEYPGHVQNVPETARELEIEEDREVIAFGSWQCPVCGEFFGDEDLASTSPSVICHFNYGSPFQNFWWTKVTHCGKKFLVGNKGI